jgi:RNA polymerase primary sigma factor
MAFQAPRRNFVISLAPQVQPPQAIRYVTGPRPGADSALADEGDMISKIKTLPQQDKEGALEKEDRETVADSPPAGLSDPAVQLIRFAKKRGHVTHDQINSVLPSEEVKSEQQIEDVLAIFSEMGVKVVETEEAREEGEEQREVSDEEAESGSGELVEVQQKVPAKSEAKEPPERTNDPVRMYLRTMGSIELLSRQGESPSPSASRPAARP